MAKTAKKAPNSQPTKPSKPADPGPTKPAGPGPTKPAGPAPTRPASSSAARKRKLAARPTSAPLRQAEFADLVQHDPATVARAIRLACDFHELTVANAHADRRSSELRPPMSPLASPIPTAASADAARKEAAAIMEGSGGARPISRTLDLQARTLGLADAGSRVADLAARARKELPQSLGAWTELLLKPAYDERDRAKKQSLIDIATAKRFRGRPGGAPALRLPPRLPAAGAPAPAAPAPAAAPEPVRCATFGTADSSPPEPESRRATFEQFQAFESDAAMFEAFDTAAGGAPPAGGAPGAEPPRSPIRRPPALGIRAPQSAGAGAAPARAMRDGARALRVGARTRTPAADPAAARAAAFSPRGAPLPRPAKFVSREVPAALAVARPSLVDVFADKQHATQVDVDIRSEALDYLFARRQLSPRRRVRDSLVAGAESLVLDDYGLSDEYSRVVIEALQGRDLLRHVSVRNNRLTALGLAQLVTALPAGVVTLDLSGNRQGCVNVEAGGALGEAFALTKCTVEKLGLASASLRSSDCVALVSGLVARKVSNLYHLDLSRNDVGAVGCAAIAFLLDPATARLRHLLLAWNNITSPAAEHVLRALLPRRGNEATLITLDLSWNCIGGGRDLSRTADATPRATTQSRPGTTAREPASPARLGSLSRPDPRPGTSPARPALSSRRSRTFSDDGPEAGPKSDASAVELLAAVLRQNTTLTHLSVASNNLAKAHVDMLAAALSANESLVGLHFDGNHSVVSSRRRVEWAGDSISDSKPQSTESISRHLRGEAASSIFAPAGTLSAAGSPPSNAPRRRRREPAAACWICGGWTLRSFACRAPKVVEQVQVHLAIDGWVPTPCVAVGHLGDVVEWQAERVLPPSLEAHEFFFSVSVSLPDDQDHASPLQTRPSPFRAVETCAQNDDARDIVLPPPREFFSAQSRGVDDLGDVCEVGSEDWAGVHAAAARRRAEAAQALAHSGTSAGRRALAMRQLSARTTSAPAKATSARKLTPKQPSTRLNGGAWATETKLFAPDPAAEADAGDEPASSLSSAAASGVPRDELDVAAAAVVGLPTSEAAAAASKADAAKAARTDRASAASRAPSAADADAAPVSAGRGKGAASSSSSSNSTGDEPEAVVSAAGSECGLDRRVIGSASALPKLARGPVSASWAIVAAHVLHDALAVCGSPAPQAHFYGASSLSSVVDGPGAASPNHTFGGGGMSSIVDAPDFAPPRSDGSSSGDDGWSPERDSLFVPRVSDEGGLYDSDSRLKRCFLSDWDKISARIANLRAFRKDHAPDAKRKNDAPAPTSPCMLRCRDALEKGFRSLRAAFRHYCVKSTSLTRLYMLGFQQLWRDAGVVDTVPNCGTSDVDRIFLATNFAGGETDSFLERHELLEGTVRIAIAALLEPGASSNVADAVEGVVDKYLKKLDISIREPDAYRRSNLYTREADAFLRPAINDLQRVFKNWAGKAKMFVTDSRWFDIFAASPDGGGTSYIEEGVVSHNDLELIFLSSKLTLVDEAKQAKRLVSLSFLDFVEAIWRLAHTVDEAHPEQALASFLGRMRGLGRKSGPRSPVKNKETTAEAILRAADRGWLAKSLEPRVADRVTQLVAQTATLGDGAGARPAPQRVSTPQRYDVDTAGRYEVAAMQRAAGERLNSPGPAADRSLAA